MKDNECVEFLQWALPRLHMRWPGFRKVRGQVCKRVVRRMQQLHINSVARYCDYLEKHPQEWASLDALSRITISRFYRDKAVFTFLEVTVLPTLVRQALVRHQSRLRVWSAGSGSGEEPYSMALMWGLRLFPLYRQMGFEVIATDVDPEMNRRAEQACYPYSSIKGLPEELREQAFIQQDETFSIKPEFRGFVEFIEQDIRSERPSGKFDLVLCRNLVFTYFDEAQQRRILDQISSTIASGGAFVIGIDEDLPKSIPEFSPWSDELRVFRKNVV
jgi:chemotaxis protein methyltransferase CheR